MNRVIKFRAWEKTEGRMLDISTMSHDAFNIVMFHDILLKGKKELKTGGKTYEFEVMQFTGLLDKNGVEIYAGDIVALGGTEKDGHKGPYEHQVVESKISSRNGYHFSYMGDTNYHAPYWAEVIGNIYENPELITNSPVDN